MRTATMLLAVGVVLVAEPAWADFEAGAEAYVRGDYTIALKEWRPLAEQGNAEAQFQLGWMYTEGEGVPRDYVQAHLWFNLSAEQGHENARTVRDRLAARMPPAQLAEAQRLAREWKPK